jgi:uroporphyrin-III C-methyltransferase/precorrin-2 dehydrogenase/sirohydrochlorin ferrochelatase
MKTSCQKGKVILAGAGPGDPELITLKTVRYLAIADVVLVDRLVSPEIIKQFINKNAQIIYVGKQVNKSHSTPQSIINDLLIKYALQGKLVVRLKGGDISIFSNILDELESLIKNAIQYELIPGITAASGAAAYAGIPLTGRGYSTAVRLLTYYKSEIITEHYWKELAHTDDTLVFYMSAESADDIVAALLRSGITKEKHIAIIEQATTVFQQINTMEITDYPFTMHRNRFASPSIIIIGKIVALHKQFSWFKSCKSTGHYFESLNQFSTHSIYNTQAEHVTRT